MTSPTKKPTLDDWLDKVDYGFLASPAYLPSEFSLQFASFVKLVNSDSPEPHQTPAIHLSMLDKLDGSNSYIANLCFRGAAKTTLFAEYLILYLGVFGSLPRFGDVAGIIYVSDSMDNGAKSARKNIEYRYHRSPFLQEWIPKYKFRDGYIELENKTGHLLGVRLFGSKTGLRGTKIFGKRPTLAILDDLVDDEDAKSKASMQLIKDTVYKGVNHALDPTRRKVIFNGTPFSKEDILVEAVESGAWAVNVYPVCEKFPCAKEDFKGAWPDRFSYDYISSQYKLAEATGKLSAFYQELMLRLSDGSERLIQEHEVHWYSKTELLAQRQLVNFYITTDFATSTKETADFSVISVWGYKEGKWYWVDGVCKRQTMDVSLDTLFSLVQAYQPQSVGIETSGQQGAFISWIGREMENRNVWFNLASSGSQSNVGIRPTADKLSRFNLVVPLFKAGKIFFPQEMKNQQIMQEFVEEIRLVTFDGIKGKDDCLDTISMLTHMKPWSVSVPTDEPNKKRKHDSLYAEDAFDDVQHFTSGLESYIV